MTAKKNWITFIIVLLISIVVPIILLCFNIFDMKYIQDEKNNFQSNAISMSSLIGGFLFTGLGILISTIDKERIKRLWDNKYLDNLYRAGFVGIIANIITIISAFIQLSCNLSLRVRHCLLYIEIITIIVSLVFFIWCVKKLVFIITRLKKSE